MYIYIYIYTGMWNILCCDCRWLCCIVSVWVFLSMTPSFLTGKQSWVSIRNWHASQIFASTSTSCNFSLVHHLDKAFAKVRSFTQMTGWLCFDLLDFEMASSRSRGCWGIFLMSTHSLTERYLAEDVYEDVHCSAGVGSGMTCRDPNLRTPHMTYMTYMT